MLSVASASSAAAAGCGSDSSASALDADGGEYFPQSVASFDPRPSSVVLWTRIKDPARGEQTVELELELATDERFSELVMLDGEARLRLSAEAAWDHTVRARVADLQPATTYYYRFSYQSDRGTVRSRVGRTRTAPAEDADVAQRFAVICCQDYAAGRYHVLRRLLAEDLDFVLHLGDYVYESTAESLPAGARGVRFSHPEQALALGGGGRAARSLDNYRDLYRTYRADPDLQALHERFPMLCIWDDHEFSNDCHGATATYFDGRVEETDVERRSAADQAWFEYIGVDFSAAPSASFDREQPFPDSMTIYREFTFGRHVSLLLTDLRRYRPDHLVPENALPGSIFLSGAALDGVDQESLVPYVDIDSFGDGIYGEVLRANADALELDADTLHGDVSVPWINSLLSALDQSDAPPEITATDDLPRGYAYHQLLKRSQYSQVGARYVLADEPFAALASARYAQSDGADQQLMGAAQRAWFLERLRRSDRTFKLWASEIVFMSRRLDLSRVSLLPPELRTKIVISAEDWDGVPNERDALLEALGALDNVVILSGDLHCFLAGTPFSAAEPERRVVELLTGSVTSTTWREAIADTVANDPSLPPGAAAVVTSVGALLQDAATKPNPHLAYQDLAHNGCSLVRVDGAALDVEFLAIEPEDVRTAAEELSGSLASRFSSERFRVPVGTKTLQRELAGRYVPWDPLTASWLEG